MVAPVVRVVPAEMVEPVVRLKLKHLFLCKRQLSLKTRLQEAAALLDLSAKAVTVEEVVQVEMVGMVAEAVMVDLAHTLEEIMAVLVEAVHAHSRRLRGLA